VLRTMRNVEGGQARSSKKVDAHELITRTRVTEFEGRSYIDVVLRLRRDSCCCGPLVPFVALQSLSFILANTGCMDDYEIQDLSVVVNERDGRKLAGVQVWRERQQRS
jgi:hypothetical protein